MAFNPLTDAECGQKNALVRLTSHLTRDHAFADTQGHLFPSSSDQLVEQFLQETRTVPQSFRMDDLMREMHEIESQKMLLPPIPATAVKEQIHDDAWAQQYIDDGNHFKDNANNEQIWAEISSQEARNRSLMQENWDLFDDGQVAGPSGYNASQYSAREFTDAVDDSRFVYSKFMRFMKQVGDGDINLEDGRLSEAEVETWSKEFMQNNPGNKTKPAAAVEKVDETAERWGENYQDEFNNQYLRNLQEELRQTVAQDTTSDAWASEFESYYSGPYSDYTFADDNPMFDHPNPLERGLELLAEGDLPSAVLCFEAAVKQEPENARAWLLLGKTQAENEQDSNAIPALKRCTDLEPGNLDALMALAVCFTNESYYSQAGQMLVKWLQNHPKYGDLVPPDFQLIGEQQKIIQDMYIKAAMRQPDDVDCDVQCGLGVLFNLSGEHEKAADCFRTALSIKNDDAKLWNRLGASLANGSKSEEAVEAYHQALSLEPGFIRARYNVGIICINLRAYKEAAEHFLTALNQQARGRDVKDSPSMSQMSDTIWSTLRMCISLMNRPDLREVVDNRNLEELNRAFDIGEH